jgi:protein-disulfide isomerase
VNVGVGSYEVKGNKNAKVKIVEFLDNRCPYCQQYMAQTQPQIIKDYVDTGKAVLYFRDYAFLGPSSTLAANGNGCANEQGKFWDWIDYMFKNQPPETDTSMFTNDNLTSIAGQLGMDTTQFSNCMTSTKYATQASTDLADGQKAGVNGTPTVFINGTPVVGAEPYTAFKVLIDQELAKK